MKRRVLKRVVGRSIFTFEKLNTILCCNVESFLNSRPLGPVTSHDIYGISPLTPAHFLLGRAARSYPREQPDDSPTHLQRWERCRLASSQFWSRWSNEYLQRMQKATKWHRKGRNFETDDLVMLTDGNHFRCQWSMGKILKTYPGKDDLVRTVDVQVETSIIPGNCNSKKQLVKDITTKTSVYRRPITKLALLLAVDEYPGEQVNLDKLDFTSDQTDVG